MFNGQTPRKSKITIPERCHPLAKFCFAEMKRQAVTYDEMEYRSGVLRSTIKAWRTHNRPGLESIEATMGVLGWAVRPVPLPDVLPPELRLDLQAVADKHGLEALPALEFISVFGAHLHPRDGLTDARERRENYERLAA